MGHWLCALDFYLSTPKEIALVAGLSDPATQSLLEVIYGGYLPNKLVVGRDPSAPGQGSFEVPLLEGRGMISGRPTAYVCENYACQLPVTEPEALAGQLFR